MNDIESWVREELDLVPDDAVTVVERAGAHAGCAFETVVTVGSADEDPFVMTVHKPMAEVDRMDLLAALAFGEH